MNSLVNYCYHWLAWKYHSFRLWLEIRKLKFWGWVYSLPSLAGYSDEAIIEGFIQYKKEKEAYQWN